MIKTSKKTVRKTPKPSLSTGKRVAIIFGLIGLLLVGMLSGLLPYAAAYLGCLKAPVSTSKFAASYSYTLPGEYGYGPSPFGQSYYCSQAEAEAAGFHHSLLTEGGRSETNKALQSEDSAGQYSAANIGFTVYIPTLVEYSIDGMETWATESSRGRIVYYDLKKDDQRIARIELRKVGADDALCDPDFYTCEVIGADSQGRKVKLVGERGWPRTKLMIGTEIGSTAITILSEDESIKKDMIAVLGSMQPYK